MNPFTSLVWRLLPARERALLLSYAPHYQQRHIDRILKGKAHYPACFDACEGLFIHIPKTAGRSLVRGLFDVKSVEHAPAQWYQNVDPDKFDRYYKFTVVRNPWDRAVSAYTYLTRGGAISSEEDSRWATFLAQFESFDDFVCRWVTPDNVQRNALFTPQLTFLQDVFGQVSMDFIGRYESLQEDFATIAARLNPGATLPHLNQSRSETYQSYYSPRSREIIERVYAQDIAALSYQFDSIATP